MLNSRGVFSDSALFQGIEGQDIAAMLQCLGAVQKHYARKSHVCREGDAVLSLGIVLSGRLHCIREDFWGNRNILSSVEPGGLFGEIYACAQSGKAETALIAAEDSDLLFMDVRRVMTTCSSACTFHTRLIRNLLQVVAEKNLELMHKMEHMTQRTIREKLLSYLSEQSRKTACDTFIVPFNRQQLAEYLSVDRSALSSELGKLRDEGLLQFERNTFTLLHPQA